MQEPILYIKYVLGRGPTQLQYILLWDWVDYPVLGCTSRKNCWVNLNKMLPLFKTLLSVCLFPTASNYNVTFFSFSAFTFVTTKQKKCCKNYRIKLKPNKSEVFFISQMFHRVVLFIYVFHF